MEVEDVCVQKSEKKVGGPLTKKQELNNHIVLMRIVVQRARVHLISKLTKEVKRLRERKGKEQEKAKRKADRIVQEILFIKKISKDKVSIFALQDKSKLEEVLQNPKSTIEDRALARLSHNKFIQAEVKKYRDENIYWELQIPVLLERSKDKRRRINKKLAEREAELALKGNRPKIDKKEEEDLESEDSEEGGSIFAEEEIKYPETKVEESKPPARSKLQDIFPKIESSNKKGKKEILKSNTEKPERKQDSISKSEGTVRIQVLTDLADLEKDDEVKTQVKITVDDPSEAPKYRPKSSFFVGGVDEPFDDDRKLERQFSKRDSNQGSDSKPIFRKGKLVIKAPKRFNSKLSSSRPDSSNRRFTKDNKSNSNFQPVGDKSESKRLQPSAPSQQSEKLHPSWEAKKRQQSTLSEFKGKKIKFDDL